jgi:uncharacterized protein YxeA
MKKIAPCIFCLLVLVGCDGPPTKAGDKIPGSEFVLLKDSVSFSSMSECVEYLKQSVNEYKVTLYPNQPVRDTMHTMAGTDAKGDDYLSMCLEKDGRYNSTIAGSDK